jgi:hypothetical protein
MGEQQVSPGVQGMGGSVFGRYDPLQIFKFYFGIRLQKLQHTFLDI